MNPKSSNQFVSSHSILKLNELNAAQCKILINKLNLVKNQDSFVEFDCVPNGSLNLFRYGDGLKSAKITKNLVNLLLFDDIKNPGLNEEIGEITSSFLGKDSFWLERKIISTKNSGLAIDFRTGVKLGLWKLITSESYSDDYLKELGWGKSFCVKPGELNWEQPFCVKNEEGLTKIWHPNWRTLGYKNGFSTKESITKFIEKTPTYLQKFYAPFPASDKEPTRKMYYRLIFFVEAGAKKIDFCGGLWISNFGFKIFQDENSIVGFISPLTTGVFF
ncbi:MAG: hypothetical protein WCT50_04135 [Patescibacteria group bacterium]